MDDADEETEAALRRTEEVQRMALERREHEIQELRKVIATKESSIDELRDVLSSLKRSAEARLRADRETLASRDDQVRCFRKHRRMSDALPEYLLPDVVRTSRSHHRVCSARIAHSLALYSVQCL